jgi:hypothetical protein
MSWRLSGSDVVKVVNTTSNNTAMSFIILHCKIYIRKRRSNWILMMSWNEVMVGYDIYSNIDQDLDERLLYNMCRGGCLLFVTLLLCWCGLFVLRYYLVCNAFWLLWDFVFPCLFVLYLFLPRHVLCLELEAFNIFAISKKKKIQLYNNKMLHLIIFLDMG